MLALGVGLIAALIWSVHDLLARKLSQGVAILPLVSIVMGVGCVALVPVTIAFGGWDAMTGRAWGLATVSGFAIVLAMGCLYKAFSLAPVRLVSPVVGAYPMLSLGIAALQGSAITATDWIAVLAICLGVAITALAARSDTPEGYAARPAVALGWAALSTIGFAATFALAQAAARQGSDLPVILIGRVVALVVFLGLLIWHRGSLVPQRGHFPILALMGVMDAAALGLVTAAGSLPRAEYASVASSLFGVLTVLLAAWFLRERVRPVQWLGIAAVFAGIAALGLHGV
jgi:uncharacterized membrane protein